MGNVKKSAYVSAEMEIIMFQHSDILTTSGPGGGSGYIPDSGLEDDPNTDSDWNN